MICRCQIGTSCSLLYYGTHIVHRILVAGSDRHIPSKSTPREIQLEPSVMPPTPEHVRVHTPPRLVLFLVYREKYYSKHAFGIQF